MAQKFYVYIDRLKSGENSGEIIYVGKGTDGRIQSFDRNQKYNRKLSKYGINREIFLETEDEKFAYDEEIRLIAEHHTYYKDESSTRNACNFQKGGKRIKSVFSNTPEETKINLSNGIKNAWKRGVYKNRKRKYKSGEEHCFYDKHHSMISNEKNRKSHLGKKHTPETIEKIKKANKGLQNCLGYKQTNEHKEKRKQSMLPLRNEISRKVSLKLRGRKLSPEHILNLRLSKSKKPILQFDLNGNFIARFISQAEATRLTGCTNISQCCLQRIKRPRKFIWRFENECL